MKKIIISLVVLVSLAMVTTADAKSELKASFRQGTTQLETYNILAGIVDATEVQVDQFVYILAEDERGCTAVAGDSGAGTADTLVFQWNDIVQPDYPRNVIVSCSDPVNDTGSIAVIGRDARNESITETFVITGGVDPESGAFAFSWIDTIVANSTFNAKTNEYDSVAFGYGSTLGLTYSPVGDTIFRIYEGEVDGPRPGSTHMNVAVSGETWATIVPVNTISGGTGTISVYYMKNSRSLTR